jgi:hypothetical protein
MTPSNRKLLAKIKAKLNPPPPPPPPTPVDMRPVLARINLMLMACHNGGKRPGESYLTGFARALQFKNEAELLLAAWNDRAEFVRRYAAASPPCYSAYQCSCPIMAKSIREGQDERKRKEAGDVCDVVIRQFLAEELANQVVDAVFPFWRRPNAKPVEVDDEVLSSIGRDLLALAAKRHAPRKAAQPRFT